MARQVVWTKKRYELICEQGMLCPEDCEKLRMHIMRCPNQEIAFKFNVDVSVIDRDIKRFKLIYDAVQRENPDLLDARSMSVYRRKRA